MRDGTKASRKDRQSAPQGGEYVIRKKTLGERLARDFRQNGTLYLLLIPAVLVVAIFSYVPMYGIIIAFQNFKPSTGFWNSEWVCMANFTRFFSSHQFGTILKNTLSISIYSLVAGYPMPIILALLLNQIRHEKYKKVLQTITYMPHFISTVVIAGMIVVFLNPNTGLYAQIAHLFGVAKPVDPLGQPKLFSSIYVLSGVWQHTGWDSIIYLAALSGIDVTLYEAATVDGANRWDKIRYIDIPGMAPTMIILLIMNAGGIMNVGFEKVFLLQNNLNLSASEIISTYVYKMGLIHQQYSFSAAVGLFNTVINFILLITVNTISRHVSETSLW